VDAKYAPHPYYTQADLLLVPCVAAKYNATYIDKGGLTLDQAAELLGCFSHDLSVTAVHASESNVANFRRSVQRSSALAAQFTLVNFNRASLSQEGGGHFSPIGAYEGLSDSVLVLDVARYKVGVGLGRFLEQTP
jgi:hypothetical protein